MSISAHAGGAGGTHYITATTHFVTEVGTMADENLNITEVSHHHFTLHCICGASAFAHGDDPEIVFNEALAALAHI